jgi:hypothetical protein
MRGDRTIRATVKPYFRAEQGKWFARGWIPERQADGRIARRRIERGPGCRSKSECQALCDQINKLYEDRAAAVRRPLTFARAVTNYVDTGGDARFLTPALMTRLGLRQCSDIDDTVMVDLTRELYPDATPATVNRQLYTPVIAVLTMAAKGGHCQKPALTRPKGHTKSPPIEIPTDDWFAAVRPHLRPHRWALITILTLHGRRPKELLTLPPAAFDPAVGTLSIPDTKTDKPVLVLLAPICAAAIQAFDWKGHDLLFRTPYQDRRNVYRDLAAACRRAGVPYFPLHAIGRHSFASRLLKEGYSVKHVMDGGGWASERMVMMRYGHLARSEVAETVKEQGMRWGERLEDATRSNVLVPDFTKKNTGGEKG